MSKTTLKPASVSVDLRRGIDHIGVCVVFIVHDKNGRVLLQKRGQQARDEHGNWDIGGGAVEFGESMADALTRELKEELCTKPLTVTFLTAYEAFREIKDVHTHWIALLHAVLVDPDTVHIGEPDKIERIDWFHKSNLPSPLHSQFWKSYQLALDMRIVS